MDSNHGREHRQEWTGDADGNDDQEHGQTCDLLRGVRMTRGELRNAFQPEKARKAPEKTDQQACQPSVLPANISGKRLRNLAKEIW